GSAIRPTPHTTRMSISCDPGNGKRPGVENAAARTSDGANAARAIAARNTRVRASVIAHATAAIARNAAATAFESPHATASVNARLRLRRSAATSAASPSASASRNGSCPIATGTTVPSAKTTTPARPASPKRSRVKRAKHNVATAALHAAAPYMPIVRARGGNSVEYDRSEWPPYQPRSYGIHPWALKRPTRYTCAARSVPDQPSVRIPKVAATASAAAATPRLDDRRSAAGIRAGKAVTLW